MRTSCPQPDTDPDDFVTLEMIGGSLDGGWLPIPLPLPPRFMQVVRLPNEVEVYRYEERYPKNGESTNPRVVYAFETYARTTADLT